VFASVRKEAILRILGLDPVAVWTILGVLGNCRSACFLEALVILGDSAFIFWVVSNA
jgi:hypothetical protein